jgi:hypothetical protein
MTMFNDDRREVHAIIMGEESVAVFEHTLYAGTPNLRVSIYICLLETISNY